MTTKKDNLERHHQLPKTQQISNTVKKFLTNNLVTGKEPIFLLLLGMR
ncbi:MAG: hypothetical protein WA421_09905 [Nitrososphaeraceae archaeon]